MQLGVRSGSAGLESAEVQTYKTATDISAGQQRRGRPFQPGQSGNPRGRPAGSVANAQAKTAICWIGQGFVQQEDVAMKQVCDDYMKASGNKLEYSIMPFMALNQKIISALTSGGDVPDLFFHDAPENFLPQNAWDDKLIDVTDVITPYESQLSETFYNKVTKRRSYYLCPIKQGATPFTSGVTSSRRPA